MLELFTINERKYRLEPEGGEGSWVLSYWVPHENRTHYWKRDAHLIEEGGYWVATVHGPYGFCKRSAR